ncbi:unnamed protein product [Dovyalis caffra]|uniref:Senescence-associated protein SPA15, chloroplastic n=1 Tax=Dovyalis caffra TaxID=77055 RepID=A0AAV1RRU1_9ROSI|nr:unnamed protein product [Dovyalis caffra]
MALNASKVSSSALVNQRKNTSTSHEITFSFSKSIQQSKLCPTYQGIELQKLSSKHLLTTKSAFSGESLWGIHGKPISFIISRRPSTLCLSTRTHRTEEKEYIRPYSDNSNVSRTQIGDKDDEHPVMPRRTIHSSHALAEACKFVHNDAKFVNERARNDITLLSRGILRLDARARKDFAILGSGFLKLNDLAARAREDTEKIDRDVKEKAERLHQIATIIKDRAESKLRTAADKHWSDGALEADLRLADFRAKQRAMEDALMALEEEGSPTANDMLGNIRLEKNGRTLDFFPGEVSKDRITAIQEAYWSMASALSEADGVDYTDPEEAIDLILVSMFAYVPALSCLEQLELLVTTLIDLDAMDGKSSVSLLAECSNSPDVNTRQALANALAAAPSMWALGNAGMGALQRLAEDKNPAIASAASKTIYELKKQWEIEEGDSWMFMMNQKPVQKGDIQEDSNDADTD